MVKARTLCVVGWGHRLALTNRGKASVKRLASAQFGVYRSSASSSAARLFLTNQQVQTDHRHVYIRACYRKNPSSRAHQKTHEFPPMSSNRRKQHLLTLVKGHRRQGPPSRSPGLHGRQAAAQRPEDRRCAMRGPEHLRRVLPREAYVQRIPVSISSHCGHEAIRHTHCKRRLTRFEI